MLVAGSFASALAVGWAPAFVVASSVLGMGASGTRLGAELALIHGWVEIGPRWPRRSAKRRSWAGGRWRARRRRPRRRLGGAYAFGAIGLAALLASGVLMAMTAIKLRPRVIVQPLRQLTARVNVNGSRGPLGSRPVARPASSATGASPMVRSDWCSGRRG